jgi:hypothetical protein
MRATILAVLVLAVRPAAAQQDCCRQGEAKPWKAYNAGVRWRASLTQEPERASELMAKDFRGATLAEREKALAAAFRESRQDAWKGAIGPAVEEARAERKLILFFQLVGDLDLEGC